MKNIIYAIVLTAMVFQSCSHTLFYEEAEYKATDSQYPVQTLQFAYHADNRKVSSSLAKIGNKVFLQVKADNAYNTALQTAVDFEKQANGGFKEHDKYEVAITDGKNILQTVKQSKEHNSVIKQLSDSRDALSNFTPSNYRESWKRIYQLSHRGIIQHYMNLDADFRGLNNKNKALVYGYILKNDIAECGALANVKVSSEVELQSSVLSELGSEISSRESILKKIEQQKKAEEERLRKQREAEERARLEQIRREEAQQRWYDDSWLDGKWNLVTQFGVCTIYIDTDRQTVKQYHKLYNSNPLQPASLNYSGRYSIYNATANGVNCKVINYGETTLIAYPDNGRLRDTSGDYFKR